MTRLFRHGLGDQLGRWPAGPYNGWRERQKSGAYRALLSYGAATSRQAAKANGLDWAAVAERMKCEREAMASLGLSPLRPGLSAREVCAARRKIGRLIRAFGYCPSPRRTAPATT